MGKKIKIGKDDYSCTFGFDFTRNHLFKDSYKEKNILMIIIAIIPLLAIPF
ncbi:MAG: hypothetical protein J6581_05355 [Apibacter sp.]|nr:hypothetical protein [Apibacter sp.]